MCSVAVQGLKIDSMTDSEKFFYEVKQHKRNTVTGDPRRNSTRVVRMAGNTHDNTGLRKQPSFVSGPSDVSQGGCVPGSSIEVSWVFIFILYTSLTIGNYSPAGEKSCHATLPLEAASPLHHSLESACTSAGK